MTSSFSDLKKTALEKRRTTLIEQYEAANAQLRGTLSAADRITIQEQIANLEREIEQVENELAQLKGQLENLGLSDKSLEADRAQTDLKRIYPTLADRVQRNLQRLEEGPLEDFKVRLANFLEVVLKSEPMCSVIQQILNDGQKEVAGYEQAIYQLARSSTEAAKILEQGISNQNLNEKDGDKILEALQRLREYDQDGAIKQLLFEPNASNKSLLRNTDNYIEKDDFSYVSLWRHIFLLIEDIQLPSSVLEGTQQRLFGKEYEDYKQKRLHYNKSLRTKPWGSTIRLLAWAEWLNDETPRPFGLHESWLLERELNQLRQDEELKIETISAWAHESPRGVEERLRQHAEDLRGQAIADAENLVNEIFNRFEDSQTSTATSIPEPVAVPNTSLKEAPQSDKFVDVTASDSPRATEQKEGWSRNDKIALVGVIVTIVIGIAAIAATIIFPEIRQALGLETPIPSPTATFTPTATLVAVVIDPTGTSTPTSTPTLVPTELPIATPTVPTATPTTTPTPGAILRDQDGATMVFVPAGEFLMGSTLEDIDKFTSLCRQECQRSDFEDELDQHPVSVEAFWIDETEVTNAQYKRCVEMGQCNPSEFVGDNNLNGDSQPVVGVSWKDAMTYCEWVGARLPTEAEWEKAARGTDGSLYPWGDVFEGEAVNYGYQHNSTLPVKTLDNGGPYGVYDTVGNVWEWTSSLYQAYDYDFNDGRENLERNGPRVIRGGAWVNESGFVHAASRSGEQTDHRYGRIGFRCAQSHL